MPFCFILYILKWHSSLLFIFLSGVLQLSKSYGSAPFTEDGLAVRSYCWFKNCICIDFLAWVKMYMLCSEICTQLKWFITYTLNLKYYSQTVLKKWSKVLVLSFWSPKVNIWSCSTHLSMIIAFYRYFFQLVNLYFQFYLCCAHL